MSESSFPFEGGTAVATPPAPQDVAVEEPGTSRDKNTLLVAGGAAVVLVLAVVGYFLFFAGGSPEAAPAPSGKPVAPAAPAPADASGTTVKSPKIKAKNFGRDPFKPLIVEQADTTTTGGDTTTTTPTTTGSTTTTTTDSTSGTTTDTGTVTPVQSTAHSFRVVAVAPDNGAVDVKVDGKVYRNLKAGEVFATYFKVVLIGGTTNAFQYGEEKFNVLGTKRLTIA